MSEFEEDLATFKIIIVGESGAGKSTILVRYV
jgi:GTPase SAR1 family protein